MLHVEEGLSSFWVGHINSALQTGPTGHELHLAL